MNAAGARGPILALLLCFGCAAAPKVAFEREAPFTPRAAEAREAALEAAKAHADHLWRDRKPWAGQDILRGYVEIGAGGSDKREFSIADNALVVDRVLDPALGGYPTNYGFVPRTIAYDGDPLDVLVLGPRLEPGSWAEGKVLAVLHMEDEKGEDPKIVVSPVDEDGVPMFELSREEKARIARWFAAYKANDPKASSTVRGWGDPLDARRVVEQCERYFEAGPEGLEE